MRVSVARQVGRLVEVRCTGNPTEADVAQFRVDAAAVLTGCLAQLRKPAIACCDFRGATLLRPVAAEQITELMRRDNRSVERSGILASKSATFKLQASRLLRESAGEQRRRVFTEIEPLSAWLGEVLLEEERARLGQFIDEYDPNAHRVDPVTGWTLRPPENKPS